MSESRHPVLENAVYALALLLALIVGYYGLRRGLLAVSSGGSVSSRPAPPSSPAKSGPPRKVLVGSPTEESVSDLPPLQISRTGRPRAAGGPVPSPVDKKN